MAWLDLAAEAEYGKPFADIAVDEQARLTYLLKQEYRRNTYDEATGTVTVTDRRAQAMAETGAWYQRLYGPDPELRQTRAHYAIKENTLPDHSRRADLDRYFLCTHWAPPTTPP